MHNKSETYFYFQAQLWLRNNYELTHGFLYKKLTFICCDIRFNYHFKLNRKLRKINNRPYAFKYLILFYYVFH